MKKRTWGMVLVFSMAFSAMAGSFNWIGATDLDWDADGVWETADSERTAPGVIGDEATITGKVTIAFSADKTLSKLNLKSTFDWSMSGAWTLEGANTLTLAGVDGGAAVLTCDAYNANYSRSSIGNWAAGSAMALHLEDPVDIAIASQEYTKGHLIIGAKMTGGSAEKPSDIRITVSRGGFLILTNPSNEFRGDFKFDPANTTTAYLVLGLGNKSATDGMLGDPENEIVFAGKDARLLLANVDAEGLKRTVRGSGSIQAQKLENQWFIASKGNLVLGDGCVLIPSKEDSPHGTISIVGNAISVHSNTTFRMSVSPEENDQVTISPTADFTFRGKVEVVEESAIEPGSQFTLFTIAKEAKTVTFAPDSLPEDYNFKCEGDASSGWTIVATKKRQGADVSALQVSRIADTYATLNCEVTQVAATPVTVRAYYGTTDGGNDPAAWDASVVMAEGVTETGILSLDVHGLKIDTQYFVRFAVDDGLSLQMSVDVATFTTRAFYTPDTFTWSFAGTAWSDENAWTIAGPYARLMPGVAGDVAVIPKSDDHTILVDGDYTVGTILLERGKNQTIRLTAEQPHVLTLDNGTEQALLESRMEVYHWYFGTSLEDGLSLRLASPLKISRTQAYNYDFWLYAKISGGSYDSPVPISLSCTSDQYGRLWVHVFNPENDFIGDWYIGENFNGESKSILYLGDATHPSVDGMLGNAANRIVLCRLSTLAYFAGGEEAASCRRRISGNGAVTCTGDFQLTDEAHFSPCGMTGTGFGTISISSTGSLSDSAGTTYCLDVSATGTEADKVELRASGALSISGLFEIVPDDSGVKIAEGARWTIGSVSGVDLPERQHFSAGNGFRVFAEGNAENGWTLYAEKGIPGLLFILR
ncbi:MAG: hypothetical protein ACI4QT_08450 [Kiritimatiellia bacterium]